MSDPTLDRVLLDRLSLIFQEASPLIRRSTAGIAAQHFARGTYRSSMFVRALESELEEKAASIAQQVLFEIRDHFSFRELPDEAASGSLDDLLSRMIATIPRTCIEALPPSRIEFVDSSLEMLARRIENSTLTRLKIILDDFRAARASNQAQPAKTEKTEKRVGQFHFPTPPDTAWKDISISVLDELTVRVHVGEIIKSVTHIELGCKKGNTRDAGPNVEWKLLMECLENGGIRRQAATARSQIARNPEKLIRRAELEESGLTETRAPSSARRDKRIKQKERLAAKLRRYFGVEGDPFYDYNPVEGWKPRFKIDRSTE